MKCPNSHFGNVHDSGCWISKVKTFLRSIPGETEPKHTKIAMVSVHKTCQLLKGTGGDKKNPLEKTQKKPLSITIYITKYLDRNPF